MLLKLKVKFCELSGKLLLFLHQITIIMTATFIKTKIQESIRNILHYLSALSLESLCIKV